MGGEWPGEEGGVLKRKRVKGNTVGLQDVQETEGEGAGLET